MLVALGEHELLCCAAALIPASQQPRGLVTLNEDFDGVLVSGLVLWCAKC